MERMMILTEVMGSVYSFLVTIQRIEIRVETSHYEESSDVAIYSS